MKRTVGDIYNRVLVLCKDLLEISILNISGLWLNRAVLSKELSMVWFHSRNALNAHLRPLYNLASLIV